MPPVRIGKHDHELELCLLTTVLFLASCSTSPWSPWNRNPVTVETKSAGEYLVGLHQKGLLPGDSKRTHGEVVSEQFTLPPSGAKDIEYPFFRTFQWTIKGVAFTNNYTVVRQSQGSTWQLQKAWRTGAQGEVVQEWPVN